MKKISKTQTNNAVTKEVMQAYEDVRASGLTNMWDTTRVEELSFGVVTRADSLEIMKDYEGLMKEHKIKREDCE